MNKLKILFVTAYYYPEKYTSDFLIQDKIDYFLSLGHEVIVLAPNPIREISKQEALHYKKNKIERINDNFTIYRVNSFFSKQRNKIYRVLRIFSMTFRMTKKIKNIEFDVAIISSTPPFFLPNKISKIVRNMGKKSVFDVNDIFPENLGNNWFLNLLFKSTFTKTLHRVDSIATLSLDMKNSLIKKQIPSNKINIIGTWPKDEDSVKVSDKILINSNLINVFYIGNIGEFQGIKTLLSCFPYLNDDRALHFVGGGRLSNYVQSEVKKMNSARLTYTPRVSNAEANFLYSVADANLITLNKNVIFYACPSKTPNVLLAQKPIVAMIEKESEFAKNILRTKENYIVVPDDFLNLARVINRLQKNIVVEKNEIFLKSFDKKNNLILWNLMIINLFN